MLLNNHGAVVWAPNLDEVLLKTETLELLCRMVVTAQAGNIHLKYLGQEKARDFIKHLRRISGQSEVA